MTNEVFTYCCDKFGCLSQGSSWNYDQVCQWAEEHDALDDGHQSYIIRELDNE